MAIFYVHYASDVLHYSYSISIYDFIMITQYYLLGY